MENVVNALMFFILIVAEMFFISYCIISSLPSIKIQNDIRRIINTFYKNVSPKECAKYVINYYNVADRKFCRKTLKEIMAEIERVFCTNIKEDGTSSNLKCDYKYLRKLVKSINKYKDKIEKKKENYPLLSIIVAIVIGFVQIIVNILQLIQA